ncbi:GM19636 [Drosophila sechellia]|uniref:GM19636 n=1 Tax=Drosophila sechellia TaxID=7238 RepID=B4IMB6_DROSE|nr:GM19636 [Drosophila sechellia]
MGLNEVKGVTISDFIIDIIPTGDSRPLSMSTRLSTWARGTSKMTAKNAACEKAWRDFIIAKMTPKPPRIHQVEIGAEPIDTNEDEADAPDDDLPMLNLASFAHLQAVHGVGARGLCRTRDAPFSQCCPAGRRGCRNSSSRRAEGTKEAASAYGATLWLGDHAPGDHSLHCRPAHLTIFTMRPGLSYSDYGSSGDNTTGMQHLGITVDNQEFHAHGRSKKIARLNVAVKVCNSLFGTNFAYGDTA